MKTALVHDWLVTPAGAEKALESLYRLYPSPLYTLVFSPEMIERHPVFKNAEIRASFLQKFPEADRLYRNFLPLYPLAVGSLDLSGFDLILSSSHAAVKAVRRRQGQLHICYCYTPMRYAWDLREEYLQNVNPLARPAARALLKSLARWDAATADRVDHFVAISNHVAARIRRNYGREAAVIYPPVDVDFFPLVREKASHFVTVSRMVPYKRIGLIVQAFAKMGRPLIVVGDGPERSKIERLAGPSVHFLGAASREDLRRHLSTARGFVFAAEEDFGIAPVEAMAAGTPVIGFGRGGLLETVTEGKHGVFFKEPTVESLIEAVGRFDKLVPSLDPTELRRNAERFSRERFEREFKSFVEEKWREFSS